MLWLPLAFSGVTIVVVLWFQRKKKGRGHASH